MRNRLIDLETFEVSLVDKPANNRKFFLFKADSKQFPSDFPFESIDECIESMEGEVDDAGAFCASWYGKEQDNVNKGKKEKQFEEPFPYDDFEDCVENESDRANPEAFCSTWMRIQAVDKVEKAVNLSARLSELSDSEVAGFFGALKRGWQDMGLSLYEDLGRSLLASMSARGMSIDPNDEFVQATGWAEAVTQIADNPDHYRKKESEEQVSEETKFDLSAITKAEDVESLPKELQPAVLALWKEREELKAEIQKAQEAKEIGEYIKKAEAFENLSVEAKDFGSLLYRVSKSVEEDDFNKLMEVLKSADEVSQSEEIFKSAGSDQGSDSGGDSWHKIEKLAQTYATENSVTKESAINIVLRQNPELYKEYLTERGGK